MVPCEANHMKQSQSSQSLSLSPEASPGIHWSSAWLHTDEMTSSMTGVPGGWKGFIQSEPSHHSALSLQARSERTHPGTLSPKHSFSPVSALYMVSTMTWNYLFHIVAYLFIEYHTQNCYMKIRTLALFFPHHVLGCVTQYLMHTGIPHSLVVLMKNSGRP